MKRVFSGLSGKLTAAFLSVALVVAAFVALAFQLEVRMIRDGARLEAERLARTIAAIDIPDAIHHAGVLQRKVDLLAELHHRDVVIVDRDKIGVADANHYEVGEKFDHDPDNEVGRTLEDGVSRTFVERTKDHPEGVLEVVVPFRATPADPHSAIVGAVVLEYTSVYNTTELRNGALYGLGAAGLACVLFAAFVGWRVSQRIAARIRALERGVAGMSNGDFAVRVADAGSDEIAALGAAFNRMAADLQREVTARETASRRVRFLAYHDNLTGLPNRAHFASLLKEAIAHAARASRRLAVLFIDLDRFKAVNDTLGHEAGDALLREAARRFRDTLRHGDVLARLGGDEFVALLPDVEGEDGVARVAAKLLSALGERMVVLDQSVHVSASIGIGLYPDNGADEATLLKNADIAMYQAKEEGKSCYCFYSAQLSAHSLERLTLEADMRRALERGEFVVHYQPKIDLASGRVTGAEALVRWQHPEKGLLLPAKFIALAEETGLIVPLGNRVLKTACEQLVLWQAQGLPPVPIAVNISPRQFLDPSLLDTITSILWQTGAMPQCLELEITETTLMQQPARAVETLKQLKRLGLHLAIDDFGTGYSSLSSLKSFPIDTIKVDRAFIRNLPVDSEDKAITEAIIAMGKTLSLTVVAEGVETREQADFLRSRACDQFQGYYFSKPVRADQFPALFRDAEARLEMQPAV